MLSLWKAFAPKGKVILTNGVLSKSTSGAFPLISSRGEHSSDSEIEAFFETSAQKLKREYDTTRFKIALGERERERKLFETTDKSPEKIFNEEVKKIIQRAKRLEKPTFRNPLSRHQETFAQYQENRERVDHSTTQIDDAVPNEPEVGNLLFEEDKAKVKLPFKPMRKGESTRTRVSRDYVVPLPKEWEKEQVVPEKEDVHFGKRCIFCHSRKLPPLDPMNWPFLLRFLTTNGRILPRRATRLCKLHQRRVGYTVKRARAIGVLTRREDRFQINDPFIRTEDDSGVSDSVALLPSTDPSQAVSLTEQELNEQIDKEVQEEINMITEYKNSEGFSSKIPDSLFESFNRLDLINPLVKEINELMLLPEQPNNGSEKKENKFIKFKTQEELRDYQSLLSRTQKDSYLIAEFYNNTPLAWESLNKKSEEEEKEYYQQLHKMRYDKLTRIPFWNDAPLKKEFFTSLFSTTNIHKDWFTAFNATLDQKFATILYLCLYDQAAAHKFPEIGKFAHQLVAEKKIGFDGSKEEVIYFVKTMSASDKSNLSQLILAHFYPDIEFESHPSYHLLKQLLNFDYSSPIDKILPLLDKFLTYKKLNDTKSLQRVEKKLVFEVAKYKLHTLLSRWYLVRLSFLFDEYDLANLYSRITVQYEPTPLVLPTLKSDLVDFVKQFYEAQNNVVKIPAELERFPLREEQRRKELEGNEAIVNYAIQQLGAEQFLNYFLLEYNPALNFLMITIHDFIQVNNLAKARMPPRMFEFRKRQLEREMIAKQGFDNKLASLNAPIELDTETPMSYLDPEFEDPDYNEAEDLELEDEPIDGMPTIFQ